MAEQITIGGRVFDYRPLKLGEMRQIQAAIRADVDADSIGWCTNVVAAGLPGQVTAAELLEIEAPFYELDDAAARLISLTGFKRPEPAPGEASPQPEMAAA